MKSQMIDKLFVDAYLMMNFEITFSGVRSWFDMAGLQMDDASIFRALLVPEQLTEEMQTMVTRFIVYRYEDVFFQVNRLDEDDEQPHDIMDPIHQLLIRLMNTRSLNGEQDALIDLGVILSQDKRKEEPVYPSLHSFFN